MKDNPRYQGRIIGHSLDVDIPSKTYFIDVLGRDPKKYEWASCGIDPEGVAPGLTSLLDRGEHIGVPHIVTAFPHVVCVYRWGDPEDDSEGETNIYPVGYGDPVDGPKMDIQLLDRPITGCDAELQIFAMEFGFRKLTGDYAAYLELFVPNMTFGEIANPNMIRDHLLKQRGSVETRDLFEGQK